MRLPLGYETALNPLPSHGSSTLTGRLGH